MKQRIRVVAALIWQDEGDQRKMLICQRPETKARGLLWEFAGGKVEAGETPEAALIRECKEELDVLISPNSLYCEVEHTYPDVVVQLSLYSAHIVEGIPQRKEHADLRWITPLEMDQFAFCPADQEILKNILFDYAKERIKTGRWRHFKGNSYEVVGIAKHSETLEPMVVYRALYGEGDLWTRPVSMWLENVTRDGRTFPRFVYEGSN